LSWVVIIIEFPGYLFRLATRGLRVGWGVGVGGEDVVINKLELLEAAKLRSEERGMFVERGRGSGSTG
jgi:hypothetical protein